MIEIKDLTIQYDRILFENQSLSIHNQCLTFLIGESGCGKTSLLYYIGLISKKHDGILKIDGQDVHKMSENQCALIRRNDIGYVFQEYILLDYLSVFENMQYFASMTSNQLNETKAKKLLNDVHLDIELDRNLNTLSGGQKQRLAIACALVKNPKILILDEPTSALDRKNKKIIFEILSELKNKCTIIVATHDQEYYSYSDEIIEIKNNQIKKIKTTTINEQVLEKKEQGYHSLTLSFYLNYIKQFKTKVKLQSFLLELVLTLTLLLNIFTIQIFDYLITEAKQSVSPDSLGQIYLKDNSNNFLEQLDDYHIVASYPYYETHININEEYYPVIPYYDEIDQSQKIWTDFNTEKGMFLSFSLYRQYNKILVANSMYNYSFRQKDNTYDKKCLFSGILVQNMPAGYTDSDMYVAVYYKNIDVSNEENIDGYTLFFDNYDYMVSFIKEMKNDGYDINYDFNQFINIQTQIENYSITKNIMIIAIVLISSFIVAFVYRSYFENRKKEFALLKSNGVLNKEIINLVMLEFHQSVFYLCIPLILIAIIVSYLLHGSLLEYVFIVIISILLISIILFLFISFNVKRINPENIIRDE